MQSFIGRADSPESRQIGPPSSGVLAISTSGELALMLGCQLHWGECRGTIAQMPLAGGAPKEVLENSDSADWDTHGNLAIVRPIEGRYRVEYPIGKVLYENTTGWISHLRFSPRGDRIAFLDHPGIGNNDGSVEVVDINGHKTTLAANRKGLKGLAWTPSGDEVWFSGSSNTRAPVLSAVTLAGKERIVLQTPGWTEIMDIAPDGRVLLLRQNPRTNIIYRPAGSPNDRRLSRLDWSTSADLSADGRNLLFYEWGEAVNGVPTIYMRDTEGGEAVRLGEGKALALSRDQKWVLALKAGPPAELILLPTGAGASKVLPRSGIEDYYSGAFFPDGKKILFAGEGSDHIPRSFVQDIDGGEARAVTADDVRATLISSDGKRLAAYGRREGDFYVASADGGKLERIPGTAVGDELIQWSDDGRFLYVRTLNDSAVELFRIDLSSGERKRWNKLEVPDNVGFISIEEAPGAIRMTRDGKSYVYTFWQARGELFIAEGLK
jgi:eukaryotic-like serine/threonine-protein kinase